MKKLANFHTLTAAISLAALAQPIDAAVTAGGTVGDSAVFTAASAGETMAAATGEGLNGTDLDHTFDTPAGTACPTYEWNPNGNNNAEIDFSSYTAIGLWRATNYGDPANSGSGEDTQLGGNSRPNIEALQVELPGPCSQWRVVPPSKPVWRSRSPRNL